MGHQSQENIRTHEAKNPQIQTHDLLWQGMGILKFTKSLWTQANICQTPAVPTPHWMTPCKLQRHVGITGELRKGAKRTAVYTAFLN